MGDLTRSSGLQGTFSGLESSGQARLEGASGTRSPGVGLPHVDLM